MSEAADKTTPASPRRLADAIRAGHVPTSHVLSAVVGLSGSLLLCMAGAGWAVVKLVGLMRSTLRHVFAVGAFDLRVSSVLRESLPLLLMLLGPVVLAAWALPSLLALLQSRGRLQLPGVREPRHKAGRAAPVIVMVATLAIGAVVVWAQRGALMRMARPGSATFLGQAGGLTAHLLLSVCGALCLLAGVDLLWQRWRWRQALRMSRTEVDEEARRTFGDPALRRERQRLSQVLLKKREPGNPANP
ncbi:MAG: EscU/YscU/HrcU family type III secretion system export apparatus switch protein [Deltaproteobacteria bacterium]|nr:EscU/YscU/HrcU family type III secretion system export apparatus switch protein [Deltaproteobacteria bacterium]